MAVPKALWPAGGERVTKSDDERLLSDLRAGQPEACAELVRDHYPAVYRFLLHLTRDVHEAEDLTQETFAAAWQKLAGFRGGATLATWLHRIAYTKFIDAHRAGRRAAELRERLSDPRFAPADPFDVVMADDEARHLYQALDRLGVPERTVLVLHYLQGLSYREMADVTGEPAGTVKWRTAEALDSLRTLLTNEVSEHAPRRATEPGPVI
jgi:RNA polymerase sigma-70 factor (ECF subfamily)